MLLALRSQWEVSDVTPPSVAFVVYARIVVATLVVAQLVWNLGRII